MADLIKLAEPPDAVFVANNLMSVGALQCLRELGQAPPSIGMVAFGDHPFGGPDFGRGHGRAPSGT